MEGGGGCFEQSVGDNKTKYSAIVSSHIKQSHTHTHTHTHTLTHSHTQASAHTRVYTHAGMRAHFADFKYQDTK